MSEELLYRYAREKFDTLGVDAEEALKQLDRIPVSLHCWQGDDVAGFEAPDASGAGSGCLATGNYPGKARNASELMADIEQAASLIPGPLRLNLHASYATDGDPRPDRDELTAGHFRSWIDWAKAQQLGIDFNPTCFSHPAGDEIAPETIVGICLEAFKCTKRRSTADKNLLGRSRLKAQTGHKNANDAD